jgi:hypothetical protein
MTAPTGGEAGIGTIMFFYFKVTNNSPDLNWIANVHFTFPDCCTVVSGSYDDSEADNPWDFDFSGMGSSAAHFTDGDDLLYGEIAGAGVGGEGEYGWFVVEVDVSGDCPEQSVDFLWLLEGDNWGEAPHDLAGSIPMEFIDVSPAAAASWSTLKSLY